jgi:hypothetical protein
MLDRLRERFSDRRCAMPSGICRRLSNWRRGLMLNRFQGWRERGWSVDASTYARPGSVWRQCRHPSAGGRALADLAEIPVRYLAWEQGGEVKAIPTWGP